MREERKNKKLKEGQIKFAKAVMNAGYITEGEALEYLAISKVELSDLKRKGGILAVSLGGEDVYPEFQFLNGGVSPRVSEILSFLGDVSSTAKFSFLKGRAEGFEGSVVDVISGATEEEFEAVRRQAILFCSHIPF